MNATPRPWKTAEAGNGTAKVIEKGGLNIVTCHYSINTPDTDTANAELIVRAVNCHEELIAALHLALEQREPGGTLSYNKQTDFMAHVLKKARGTP